jgi:hypothetical protein
MIAYTAKSAAPCRRLGAPEADQAARPGPTHPSSGPSRTLRHVAREPAGLPGGGGDTGRRFPAVHAAAAVWHGGISTRLAAACSAAGRAELHVGGKHRVVLAVEELLDWAASFTRVLLASLAFPKIIARALPKKDLRRPGCSAALRGYRTRRSRSGLIYIGPQMSGYMIRQLFGHA